MKSPKPLAEETARPRSGKAPAVVESGKSRPWPLSSRRTQRRGPQDPHQVGRLSSRRPRAQRNGYAKLRRLPAPVERTDSNPQVRGPSFDGPGPAAGGLSSGGDDAPLPSKPKKPKSAYAAWVLSQASQGLAIAGRDPAEQEAEMKSRYASSDPLASMSKWLNLS